MTKSLGRILKVINMFDDVGVYAITSSMIKEYFDKRKEDFSDEDVDNSIEELSAQDMISWDVTKTYFRPVKY